MAKLTLSGARRQRARACASTRSNSAVRLERRDLSQTPFDRWQARSTPRSWLATPPTPAAASRYALASDLDLHLNTLLMAATDLARLEKLTNPGAANCWSPRRARSRPGRPWAHGAARTRRRHA